MGTITVEGNLNGGPGTVSEGFPSASFNASLRLISSPKGFGAATGVLSVRLNSPSAFAPLAGVPDNCQRANFFYLKCDTAIALRLTFDDGIGGDTLVVLPAVRGLFVAEFDDVKFLKLIEAQGSAQLEWLASGNV